MRRSDKVKNVVFLFFALLPVNSIRSTEMKIYSPSKPQVLNTLLGYDTYVSYDSAQIFVEEQNHIIVLCSFGYRDGNAHKEKVLLFVLDNNEWISSSDTLSGYPSFCGFVSNGAFQAYSISIPLAKEPQQIQIISVYELTPDMKLCSQPARIIKMDSCQKVFSKEDYRIIRELWPLEGKPGKFFIGGYYVEHRLNPVDFIGRVITCGHWGFVNRLFGAIVEHEKIIGYYNTPEKLKTNENSADGYSVVSDNKVHRVRIKYREYHDDPEVIQYISFDLTHKQWAQPIDLFKGHKKTDGTFSNFSTPCLVSDGEDVYCTWSWTVVDTVANNRVVREGESGVYFCSRSDGQWSKPTKIADLGSTPRVVVDNGGTAHIFWIEKNEGLFYKYKTEQGWSEKLLAVEDRAIRTKETGLPGLPVAPFGVAVDKQDNFHITYIRAGQRKRTGDGFQYTPEELVYIKLTPRQD